MIIGAIGYFGQKNAIAEVEFWGDEMGVIDAAQLSFAQIAPKVQTSHIAVPPLDYQLLHFWLKLIKPLTQTDEEFWWRIPYMFYHILGAAFFSWLIFFPKVKDNLTKTFMIKVSAILAFLVYLTNPILLAYSLEIRFYILSLLFFLILWFGIDRNYLKSFWWWILIFFGGLNSSTFFVVCIAMLLGYSIVKLPKLNQVLSLTPIFLGLITIIGIYSKTLLLPKDYAAFSWQPFKTVLESFFYGGYGWQLLIIMGLTLIFTLIKKNLSKLAVVQLKILSLTGLFYTLAISLALFLKPYFDVGIRNYLFLIPISLLIIFICLKSLATKIYLGIIGLALIFNMLILQHVVIARFSFIFKDCVNGKILTKIAKPKNSEVIVVLNQTESKQLQDWYLATISWYLKHGQIPFQQQNNSNLACEKFINSKSAVLLAINDANFVCPKVFYKVVLGKNTILVNQPN